MSRSEILAKSDGTTLEKHTNDLFECYENWLAEIQVINPAFYHSVAEWDEVIRDVIFFHDQGKRLIYFQKYLKDKKTDYVYHELISIALISRDKRKSWVDCADYAMNAIALHHHRSADKLAHAWKIWDEQIKSVQDDYAKNPDNWEDMIQNGWDGRISNIKRDQFYQPLHLQPIYDDIDRLKKHIFFKGMLHKCDYAASAGAKKLEEPYKGSFSADIAQHFDKLFKKNDKKLSLLQEEAAKLSNKSVILIAPTGSGKTELSMNWVRKDSACKVFYLLGMRTAVNKMHTRWQEGFGDNVTLLHGEIAYEYMNEPENDTYENLSDRLTLIRQLASPITIATADQLVISTLKYHSFETVYLTCAYSQIIVDEIQSFDPQAMAIIVFFLKEIHGLGGRFMLMTATLPPFIKDEFLKLSSVELLDPLGNESYPESYNMHKKRHRFCWLENSYINSDLSIDTFIESYQSGKSVLIICNTVAIAQDITQQLTNRGVEVNLLHSRFTRGDRGKKEERITKDAPSGGKKPRPTIWVSTQIVEASLDIDFDEMYTEICTIDSLLQRFGRCWRNRDEDYTAELPNIFIYDFDHEGTPKNYTDLIYDKELLKATREQIAVYNDCLLTEKDKYELFNKVFAELNSRSEYIKRYKEMLDWLKNGGKAENRNKAQEAFRKSGMLNYNIIPSERQSEVNRLLTSWQSAKDKNECTKIQAEIMKFVVSATVKNKDIAKLHSLNNPTDNPKNSKFIANLYYAPEILYKYDDKLGLRYIKGAEAAFLD